MLKKIVVLGTGGTIAGQSRQAGDNVGYTAGQVAVADLLQAIPGLDAQLAGRSLQTEQLAQIDSKDMSFAVWRSLAQRCAQHLADASVDAVVVTHGTDTLEETAFFLEQMLAPAQLHGKPLVLTCAMRPASALVPDGPQNLLDAVAVACSGTAGVWVVCAGSAHAARQVQKVHTYRVDAFDSGDAGPMGVVEEGRVRWFATWQPQPTGLALPTLAQLDAEHWPRVEVLLNYAGTSAHGVRGLCVPVPESPLRGLVVAGTGNGTLHTELETALLEAQAQGIHVLRTSRCARGQLVPGPAPAALAAVGLPPVKARIALMLSLMA